MKHSASVSRPASCRVGHVLFALAFLFRVAAQAQISCSNADLFGAYGFHSSGVLALGNTPTPLAKVGRFQFDAEGGGSLWESFNRNGENIQRANAAAVYTVTEDCRFAANILYPDGNIAQWEGTIVDGGREILFIHTDPAGTTLVGNLRKIGNIAAGGCSSADVRGAYGVQSSTLETMVNGPVVGPFVLVSTVYLDGEGNFTEIQTGTRNGQLFRTTYSGTYGVSGDCTGNITVVSPTLGLLTGDFVIVDAGKEIRLVETAYGVVGVRTLLRR